METYGFKNWQELNDEARQELEERVSGQFAQELDVQLHRAASDFYGDLVYAFNMPDEDAEELTRAALDVWFDMRSGISDVDDLGEYLDEKVNNESDQGEIDWDKIREQRDWL